MTWFDGFVVELTGGRQTKSVAEYLNGPGLFIIVPKQLAEVVSCVFSREAPNSKISNDPIGMQFRFGWRAIFKLDP
jgi:hypothetical protein